MYLVCCAEAEMLFIPVRDEGVICGYVIDMNFSNHQSQYITLTQAKNLRDAASYAFCINRQLNQFITVHYETAGVKLRAHAFRISFFKHYSDWLRERTGYPPYYVWVHENAIDAGLHFHALVHVPLLLLNDFTPLLRDWIQNAGGKFSDPVLDVQTVWFSDGPSLDYLEAGLKNRLEYILKGLDPKIKFMAVRHKPQGTVFGKRCGISELLGAGRRVWSPSALRKRRLLDNVPGLQIDDEQFVPRVRRRSR